jgi:hypothetical protein
MAAVDMMLTVTLATHTEDADLERMAATILDEASAWSSC